MKWSHHQHHHAILSNESAIKYIHYIVVSIYSEVLEYIDCKENDKYYQKSRYI